MREFLVRYIDGLIPLAMGILACFFPQTLTKVDLTKPEHKATAGKIKWAGRLLLAAALILILVSVFEDS
ncbi:MAG: hypothetical protein ACYS8Z_00130 [Planctomycetota bacterium]|jgi:hypothetical protein